MKKVILSLALVGLGTLATAQQREVTPEQKAKQEARKTEMKKKFEEKQKMQMEKMTKELNLSEAQISQLKALKKGHKEEMERDRAQNMEKRKQMKEQRDAEMKKILTPDQFKRWEVLRDENHKKMQEKRGSVKEK